MQNILNAPKTQLSLLLLLILLSSFIHSPSITLVKTLILALTSTIISDYLFIKLRRLPFFPPTAAIVSGLIISLLCSPALPWFEAPIAGIFAMFSKNFLRIDHHIFNPAGFGLLATGLLFNHGVSWWGVSFQQLKLGHGDFIYFMILLLPILVSAYRMRRYRIIFSFLLAYLLLSLGLNPKLSVVNIPDPTILFFAFVMLPEPMTTPNKHGLQILFGLVIALMSVVVSYPFDLGGPSSITASIPDPLIFSLLVGNMLFFKLR